MVVALATPAGRQVVFQRDGIAHGRHRRLDRRFGEHRAAEIGVQHRAGEVEQRPQLRARLRFQPGERPHRQLFGGRGRRRAGPHGPARLIQHVADGVGDGLAAEPIEQHCRNGGVQDAADGRQIAQSRRSRPFHRRLERRARRCRLVRHGSQSRPAQKGSSRLLDDMANAAWHGSMRFGPWDGASAGIAPTMREGAGGCLDPGHRLNERAQQEFASSMRSCAKRPAIAAAGSPGVAGARAKKMMTIITPTSEAGRTRAS